MCAGDVFLRGRTPSLTPRVELTRAPKRPRYRLRANGLQPRCETYIAARGRTLRVRQSWWHCVGPSGSAAIGTARKRHFAEFRGVTGGPPTGAEPSHLAWNRAPPRRVYGCVPILDTGPTSRTPWPPPRTTHGSLDLGHHSRDAQLHEWDLEWPRGMVNGAGARLPSR